MQYSVTGPSVDVPLKPFGEYLFEMLSNQRSKENSMVNAETNDGVTAEDLHLKCINVAISFKRYITEEDTLACVCENEWISTVPMIASLFTGTTIALVNPAYTPGELIHSFSISRPKLVFCKRSALENVLRAKSELSFIQMIVLLEKDGEGKFITIYDMMNGDKNVVPFEPANVNQSKPAIILSSSGTTGLPKGVMISYSNLMAALPYIRDVDYVNITSESVYLVLVPIFHILGLYLTLYGAILGGKSVFLKSFRPEMFLQTIHDFNVNKLVIVPPLAMFLAKSPLVDKYDLSSIEDILCGAAPLAHNTSVLLQARIKATLRQLYGLTETGLIACVSPRNSNKPNCTGNVIPNVTVAIKDPDTKEPLPASSKGEICVKGPTTFIGYKNNPKETEACYDENGYFLTGDVGYFDEDGHLYVVDRIKELIKCKGFQVAPAELEGILTTHHGVKDVAVIGVPDERAGEVPCAVVVKQPNTDVSEGDIIDFLKGKVATYKQLNGGVRFVDSIPKNANGKIMKREIRKIIIGSE